MDSKFAHLTREGDPPLPESGQMVGDCVIVRALGAGAMGAVYHAVRKLLKREVALKVLPPMVREKSPTAVARFLREAQSAARLDHPNIVKVYNIGEDDPWVYIEMEFVPGKSLADEIETQTLSEMETIRIGCDLASALGYAHEQGVLHRDIKPENVMLTHVRQAKIADFGLAGFANIMEFKDSKIHDVLSESDENINLTQEGAMMGTPSFMSPEQFYGLKLDGRTDTYALGASLFCMLCGKTPLQTRDLPRGNIIKMLDEHFKLPIVDIRQFRQVSPELAAVITKSLSLRPDDRHANGYELREELMAAIATAQAREQSQPDPASHLHNETATRVRDQSQSLNASEEEMWKSFSNLMRGQ